MTARSYPRRILTAFRTTKKAMMTTGMSPSVQSNPSKSRSSSLGAVRGRCPGCVRASLLFTRTVSPAGHGCVLGDGSPELTSSCTCPPDSRAARTRRVGRSCPAAPCCGGRIIARRPRRRPTPRARARPHVGRMTAHAPGSPPRRLVEHEGAQHHRHTPAMVSTPWLAILDLGDEQATRKQDEEEPGPVDGSGSGSEEARERCPRSRRAAPPPGSTARRRCRA